jgi:hypothetical protein
METAPSGPVVITLATAVAVFVVERLGRPDGGVPRVNINAGAVALGLAHQALTGSSVSRRRSRAVTGTNRRPPTQTEGTIPFTTAV